MTTFNLTKRFKFALKSDRFESMLKPDETVSLACDLTLRGFMTCQLMIFYMKKCWC